MFKSIDPDSDVIWDACHHLINHLSWLKQQQTILWSKIEALPDNHQLEQRCFLILLELFASLGNFMEQKQLLTHTLELQRWQRDDFGATCTLQRLLLCWCLFLFHDSCLTLSFISLTPFIFITLFLILLSHYHHVPSTLFLLFLISRFTPSNRETRLLFHILDEAHYSYCRCNRPATFSEALSSGPPRSGLSALSTVSSSSTKT